MVPNNSRCVCGSSGCNNSSVNVYVAVCAVCACMHACVWCQCVCNKV